MFRLTEEGRAIVARRQGALVERGNTSAWLRFKSWLFRHLHVYDEVTGEIAAVAAEEIISLRARVAELEADSSA